MHREIMLSGTYQLASRNSAGGERIDPENRLLWRANKRRLDAEALRDSILFVAGALDFNGGGKPQPLDEKNRKRTVYGFVSRKKLDPMLALFDFPNPVNTSEQRVVTNVPLQGLFFMNSPLMIEQSNELGKKVRTAQPAEGVLRLYRILLGREPLAEELDLGVGYLRTTNDWSKYVQVLLSSNEFLYIG